MMWKMKLVWYMCNLCIVGVTIFPGPQVVLTVLARRNTGLGEHQYVLDGG